ncbi:MAG: beta-eliminating lyase-related protein [bacterium]|nr:beta-eliminating lyase-related protein [bacterium]
MQTPDIIDLMSDTVTRPTPAMREAMATCEVGDDVFDSDPTVKKLQNLAAEMVGAEAALWLPTGTMANQVAVATHTHPGQEVIASKWSHIVMYELGGVGWNSLCQLCTVPDNSGWPLSEDVVDCFKEEGDHTPGTGLLCLENTHNRRGGRVMPIEILAENGRLAHERKVPIHLDGARIWNASIASGVPVPEYFSHVDSMMFCLSKGLASPAGSILLGQSDFIVRARRMRKRFGGGLRQVGILAACGIVSLIEMIDRLADDHRNAKELAHAILDSGAMAIDPDTVETNIVIFTLPDRCKGDAVAFSEAAREEGLLVTYMGRKLIRMVTHCDFNPAWIPAVVERTLKAVGKIS